MRTYSLPALALRFYSCIVFNIHVMFRNWQCFDWLGGYAGWDENGELLSMSQADRVVQRWRIPLALPEFASLRAPASGAALGVAAADVREY